MIQPEGYPKLPADFEYDTEVHESLDGEHDLFLNFYRKKIEHPKRALLVVHGLGEHGARYQHFAHYLHDCYDLILALDLRGHGRSGGTHGHTNNFDEYVDDVLLAFNVLQKKGSADLRIDLLGHSMGGLVALRTILYRPDLAIQHLLISGPAIGHKVPVPQAKVLAGKVLAKLWGNFQMETGIDAQLLSHDSAVVKAYTHDRLVHSKGTPKMYFSMLDAMEDLITKSIHPKKDTRILFQLAAEDGIIDVEVAKHFFDELKHDDKKMIVYPGLYHEIYNEVSKEQVFEDLVRFVKGGA